MKRRRFSHRSGQALVEFALVALVLYMIVGAAITFGVWIYAAGQIQQAANVGARELSQTPLAWDQTFEDALNEDIVRSRIYDDRWLVIDLGKLAEEDPDYNFFTDVVPKMPLLNQQLAPLYIRDEITESVEVGPDVELVSRQILRYPGAILARATSDTSNLDYPAYVDSDSVVQIPIVVERKPGTNGGGGAERIRWVDVVEEIDTEDLAEDDSGENPDPFSLANESSNAGNDPPRGVVALRIHYPAQSAWMSSFRDRGTLVVNAGDPNVANDADVETINPSGMRGTTLDRDLLATNQLGDRIYTGTYGGAYGLGVQGALTSPTLTGDAVGIRPYRRVLVSQAIFRREAFEATQP